MQHWSLLCLVALLIGGACKEEAPVAEASVQSAPSEQPIGNALNEFDVTYVTGQFDPAVHPSFTVIDSIHADRAGLFLRADAYEAFKRMYEAAKEDRIFLQIRSATRNFHYQKRLWENKWNGTTKIENGKDATIAYPDAKERALAILRYSSMPGTSRHHWGTDIDLNAFENDWFEQGEGLRMYTWLVANAATYGFCQPYTEKGDTRPNGYEEEKWHWTFVPVARKLTAFAKANLSDDQIAGFLGAEVATEIGVVEKYVLGINRDCMD